MARDLRAVHFHFIGVLFLLFLHSTHAVFFKLTEGQKRCFIEEVPADTVVRVQYKSLDHHTILQPGAAPDAKRTVIKMEVLDPA